MKRKKKKWIKLRHKIITDLARLVVHPYVIWKYGVKIEKFKNQGGRKYLVLLNHQTVFDQFFVGLAFKGPIYYLATEDIFSNGWISSLIKYLVAPIPIKKQTTDVSAVINCMRVAKEGGTIAIAPEGNRTYSGKTEYMNPAIAPLVKKLGLPVALFRIEGGYGVQPRWSDVLRKGKMRAYVAEVIEPETYKQLSNEEVCGLIEKGLYVNEGCSDSLYYHKKSAEYLERAVYVCPKCGLSVFKSKGDTISCTKCQSQIRYLPSKELQGIGFDFPFKFVNDWYEYQCDFINMLDTTAYTKTPLYADTVNMFEVKVYKNKHLIKQNAELFLYGDRIVVDEGKESELNIPFEKISTAAILGRNKLNIYTTEKLYQFKGNKRFNALKYANIYYRSRNISKGDKNAKFLGL